MLLVCSNVPVQTGRPDSYRAKFVEPRNAQAGQLGRDLGADPIVREAIKRAIGSAEPALSGVISLQQDGTLPFGFFYFVPVFKTPSIPTSPLGRRSALKFIYFTHMNG